jgi:hypothetical protein
MSGWRNSGNPFKASLFYLNIKFLRPLVVSKYILDNYSVLKNTDAKQGRVQAYSKLDATEY